MIPGSPARLDLAGAVERIRSLRDRLLPQRALLIGVSGIDGCGKGVLAAGILRALRAHGLTPAGLDADAWLALPRDRFDPLDPAACFYKKGLRLEEMFERLVLPLRERRSLTLEMDFAEETAASFRRHTYRFENVDVVVLEGIFLFKRAYRRHFDLALWVDCSFETALERAVARAQEGLSPQETVRVYQTTYFPAQRIHLEKDDPRRSADAIVANDPRLSRGASPAS